MTPKEAYIKGIPLKEAREKYGNWRKFTSKSYSPPRPMHEKEQFDAANVRNNPKILEDSLVNLADAIYEPVRRKHDVSEDFKRQLAAKKLLGVGYLSPRGLSDQPQFIPPDIWELGQLNFSKSEIESGSLKFENVRIIKFSKQLLGNKNAGVNINSPKTPGRPSSREKIIAAYKELKRKKNIDFSKPMTHAYPVIRSRLFYKYKTEKGFQNEAIRIAIRDDFQLTAKR